jgi:hypothetical protein
MKEDRVAEVPALRVRTVLQRALGPIHAACQHQREEDHAYAVADGSRNDAERV